MLHSHVLFPLISIHAPREGGDADNVRAKGNRPSISIHAPREEGRPCRWRSRAAGLPFQSTPPARGATRQLYQKNNIAIISIHAPREGGDKTQAVTETKLEISIHAPREGGDGEWGRADALNPPISIHAPREGGDCCLLSAEKVIGNFNPRPPRGGRPYS